LEAANLLIRDLLAFTQHIQPEYAHAAGAGRCTMFWAPQCG